MDTGENFKISGIPYLKWIQNLLMKFPDIRKSPLKCSGGEKMYNRITLKNSLAMPLVLNIGKNGRLLDTI